MLACLPIPRGPLNEVTFSDSSWANLFGEYMPTYHENANKTKIFPDKNQHHPFFVLETPSGEVDLVFPQLLSLHGI